MTEQNQTEQNQNWLDEEIKNATATEEFPRLPAMKFVENEVMEIEIDFSKPFGKYTTTNMKNETIIKALIPVKHNSEDKLLWLNKKNPLYKDIVKAGKIGQRKFKVMQTGKLEKTKYILVK